MQTSSSKTVAQGGSSKKIIRLTKFTPEPVLSKLEVVTEINIKTERGDCDTNRGEQVE